MKSKKHSIHFRFRYFIIASVLAHLVLFGLFQLGSHLKIPTTNRLLKPEIIEVSFLDIPIEKQKEKIINPTSIVESDSSSANHQLSENAKFLSEKNNTVAKETKAKSGEQFHNAKKSSDRSQANKQTSQKTSQQLTEKKQKNSLKSSDPSPNIDAPKSDIFEKTFNAYASINNSMNKKNKAAQQQNEKQTANGSMDSSTTNDNLENIDDDLMTRLNTKEYKYFGYYSRIKKQLNQWWVPKVQQKFTKILNQGRTIASEENKITKLVIILNDVGHLVKVQVLAESGVRELDDAAIEAFRAAAPFPNPPKGMVDSDGTVKIRWDCVVEG